MGTAVFNEQNRVCSAVRIRDSALTPAIRYTFTQPVSAQSYLDF